MIEKIIAGSHDDVARLHFLRMTRGKMLGNPRPKIPDAGNRRVMGGTFFQPLDAGRDNRLRRVEVRFADFQVNDIPALAFQLAGARQHFKRGFAAHSIHSLRDPASGIQLHSATPLRTKMTSKYNISLR
jgi:hypothetical protein